MANALKTMLVVAVCGTLAAGCCGWDPCDFDPCDIDLCDIDIDPCGTDCDPCDPCDDCDPCSSRRPDGIPEEAKAGEAWCRIFIPAKFEEYEEQVICEPAGCKKTWVPPQYETRTRQVCCQPAQQKCTTIPAVYENQEEQVCCCPARTEWRKVDCTPKMLEEGQKQGDCWMLVEIPAKYKTVTKRVMVTPARTETETIPAKFKTVEEQVCTKAGYYETEQVPAKYKTVVRKRQVEPCRWEWRRNKDCEVPDDAGEGGEVEVAPAEESGDE